MSQKGQIRKTRLLDAKWDPLTLPEVQSLFIGFGAPWIAGGVAIELAIGTPIRRHRDIDVLILRRDQPRLRSVMDGWDVCVPEPSSCGFSTWQDDENLDARTNSLWCRPHANSPWRLEILLDESSGENWVSRRSTAVSRSIASLGWLTGKLIPVLAPEIQLFYKAKDPRPQDEVDFSAMLPHLTAAQRLWLDDALARLFPTHPWRDRLRSVDHFFQDRNHVE